MGLLKTVLENAGNGDRMLITFPDLYSFLFVSKWISENFGEPFWILWTDAAVERINHLGKKYGFPIEGDALVVYSQKSCVFLHELEKVDFIEDLPEVVKKLPVNRDIIISFGLNFLPLYGININSAIRAIIEHERGIMFTCIINNNSDVVNKLLSFHDVFIEVEKSEDPAIMYHTYTMALKYSIRDGIATLSDVLPIVDRDLSLDI
ncbi:hypothetical protein DRP05_06830 [Archaeoglobales archaeon]|nr:MAG: hypothetical protein DRP05_06830 [Archaeoglobales archaeon]